MSGLLDLAAAIAAGRDGGGPHRLAGVNDVGVFVTVLTAGFNRHRHPDDDELLLVLEGALRVHLESGPLTLERGQAVFISRGTEHRSEPVGSAVVLSIKGETGDTIPPLQRGD